MKELSQSTETTLAGGADGGVVANAAFPLILTFSPEEKEQPLTGFIKSESNRAIYSHCFAMTLGAFLPIPWREGRGEGERGSLSSVLKARLKIPQMASLAMLVFIGLQGVFAQQTPLGHATDFTSESYFEPPHERQVKMRLSGAEASPLPGGLMDVKQLRIETFNVAGKLEMVVSAPQCNYAPLDGVASSAGHIEIQTGDGKIHVEGNGFLWRQEDNSLTISNDVCTTIKAGILKLSGP